MNKSVKMDVVVEARINGSERQIFTNAFVQLADKRTTLGFGFDGEYRVMVMKLDENTLFLERKNPDG